MVQEFADNGAAEAPDEIAARIIAAGQTRAAAAAASGMSERTIYYRLTDPSFRALVAKYREPIVDSAVGTLAQFGPRAAAVLGERLEDENPAVQVRAACAVLQNIIALREHVELAQRVERIEARLNEGNASEVGWN
jgi:hypothetical protein